MGTYEIADTGVDEPRPEKAMQEPLTTGNVKVTTDNWFSRGDFPEPDSKIVRDVKRVVDSQDDFRNKVQGGLNRHDKGAIPQTKEALETRIKIDYPEYDAMKDAAVRAFAHADGAKYSYDIKRLRGRRKLGAKVQRAVNAFAEFLAAYSGFISLMKGAAGPYGEAAYETLSIFFIVVVNKNENDSKIADLMVALRESFPELDGWTEIYPTIPMKILVMEVYKQIIEFARDATLYFLRFSTRLWMAIGVPPSRGIEKNAITVHQTLAKVSAAAMFNLHKRNQDIQVTVEKSHDELEKQSNKLEKLNRQNEILMDAYDRLYESYQSFRHDVEIEQENQDGQRLQQFKQTLELTYPDNQSTLEDCSQMLGRAFSMASKNYRSARYETMTPTYIHSLESYCQWDQSRSSCILLLGGTTVRDSRASPAFTHSWLSPAAMYVAETLRKQKARVAFYCCHPDIDALAVYKGPEILSSIIFQVVNSMPKILRKRMAQWQTLIENGKRLDDQTSRGGSHMAKIQAWFVLLKEVISLTGIDARQPPKSRPVHQLKGLEFGQDGPETASEADTPFYIILDRIDLLESTLAFTRFMTGLTDLVNDNNCLVKILITMNTAQRTWDANDYGNIDKFIVEQDLNQKRETRLS